MSEDKILSYHVASVSEITPCIKIEQISGKGHDVHDNVAYIIKIIINVI